MIGWAYSKDESERAQKCRERYEELEAMGGWSVSLTGNSYANKTYAGKCPEGVSEDDVILYCDRGCACFGGWAQINPDRSFTCKVYTD